VLLLRQWVFGYCFRRIPLTEGKFTIVDLQDFYWLNNFEWCAKEDYYGRFYAVRFTNQSEKKQKITAMHRLICNPPPGLLVDHRNNNSLDNRRDNLRLATHSQNTCNRRMNKSNASSQFRGVSLFRSRRIWYARIKIHGKSIFLGYFDSEIDAAKAYDNAAKKYHGEFARLNF
jgi:hypothetical protein